MRSKMFHLKLWPVRACPNRYFSVARRCVLANSGNNKEILGVGDYFRYCRLRSSRIV